MRAATTDATMSVRAVQRNQREQEHPGASLSMYGLQARSRRARASCGGGMATLDDDSIARCDTQRALAPPMQEQPWNLRKPHLCCIPLQRDIRHLVLWIVGFHALCSCSIGTIASAVQMRTMSCSLPKEREPSMLAIGIT